MSIFTLHRFAVPDLGINGHDTGVLRATLERLRRDGYHLVSLDEAVRCLLDGATPPRRAIAFSIDDGYSDIAHVGADVFLAYDCPVTVFLSTGFVDGDLWHWWDQIEFVCLTTARTEIEVYLGGSPVYMTFGDTVSRRRVVGDLWERCKRVSDEEKWEFIGRLAALAGVQIPQNAPEQYKALRWDEVRKLESKGLSFAPHGVSHPILSRVSDERSASEITDSWTRVRSEIERPVPLFAYPNGGPDDYGEREIESLVSNGIIAALTTTPGYTTRRRLRRELSARYELPRFAYPGSCHAVCRVASGMWWVTRFVNPA